MECTKLESVAFQVCITFKLLTFHQWILYTVPTPTSPCYDGELLLANSTYSYIDGYNFYGGRVEVCYNGTYRPVCDNGWTDNDAAVVCNSVGYDSSYYRKSDTFVLCNTLSIPTNRSGSNKWCSLWSIR